MKILDRIKSYHFRINHLIILFVILVLFQTILSYINTTSTNNLLSKTMELYRKDSAENLADLTTTSLELILEHELSIERTMVSRKITIREINIILSQQKLQQNVSDICILILSEDQLFAINDGEKLYDYFINRQLPIISNNTSHISEINYFSKNKNQFMRDEQIKSFLDESYTFHVLVPFVPMGELEGVVYMKISPDFSNIANEISSAYSETGAIFSAVILLIVLVIFYISSYMLKERDLAQQQLFEERQIQIKRQIEHEKEALFTQRIYHAHHKAEKVMGFIKADIRALSESNLDMLRNKIIKYANFVSRVIYDMKSYEPPVEVIRNPLFKTNINEVIEFIVENIFGRVFRQGNLPTFKLDLEEQLQVVPINEYVIWEIIEPLIQNSIDHNIGQKITVKIQTRYIPQNNCSTIIIEDNGMGIKKELLQTDDAGIKRIFLGHTSTKARAQKLGYGCYIAYEISKKRCDWVLDAENRPTGGARFTITIPHKEGNEII